MHSTASSSAGCSFSSSKRVTVNRDNLPLNASLHVCICGEVVLQRPITLPCGHKFHFKCARITVFASADEVCPLCEGGHDEFSLEEEQEEEENNSVSHDSSQHKLSFKYETPEVRGKTTPSVVSFPNNIRPVSLRYATQLIDDSSSAKKKNTGFFASLSPAIQQTTCGVNRPRVPFSDITAQLSAEAAKGNSSSRKIVKQTNEESCDYQSQCMPIAARESSFRFTQVVRSGFPGGGVVGALSCGLLNSCHSEISRISLELPPQNDDSLSDIEVLSNSSSHWRQHQRAGVRLNALASSMSVSMQSSKSSEEEMSLSYQQCEYSMNASMMSSDSDKENIRMLTKRRTFSRSVEVSFIEGMSFLTVGSRSLYDSGDDDETIVFPFCLQVRNILRKPVTRCLDVNIIIQVSSEFVDAQTRYKFLATALSQLNEESDAVLVSWVCDGVVVNTQSDYFVKPMPSMKEVLAKEFMRMQCNRSSSRSVDGVKEHVRVQFARLSEQRKASSDKHLIVVGDREDVIVKEIRDGKYDGINVGFVDVHQRSIVESRGVEEAAEITSRVIGGLQKEGGRKTQTPVNNVRGVKVRIEMNPHLNNCREIVLINEEVDNPQRGSVQSSNSRRVVNLTIDTLDQGETKDFLFEVHFEAKLPLTYKTARLFNCDMEYIKMVEKAEGKLLQQVSASELDEGKNSSAIEEEEEESGKSMPVVREVKNYLRDMYMLVEWRQQLQRVQYDKTVMFAFWKYLSRRAEGRKADEEAVERRFTRIFEEITRRRQRQGNSHFKEFEEFKGYYWNKKNSQNQ